MSKYSTKKGIIYRIYNSKEADKVINIIDENGERVSMLAKGVKKQKSKKSAAIEPGNLVSVKLVLGYAIPILSDIKVLNENLFWKKDYKSIVFLQFICEVIDKFVYENAENRNIYSVLVDVLNQTDEENRELAFAILLLHILSDSGNLPSLKQDVYLHRTIRPENMYSSYESVGYVSDSAPSKKEKIDPRINKTQRFILQSPFSTALKINLSQVEIIKMLKLHVDWIEMVLERELKSKKILYNIL